MHEMFARNLAAIFGLIGVLSAWPVLASGDAANGEKIFRKCGNCHTIVLDVHGLGPSLVGVVGNRPGQAPGFQYSNGMTTFAESGAVWDDATLDVFLTKPRRLVKGTRMAFRGLKKDQDRADVIAYLKQLQSR
ncbi:MAG: c-type cytochrome, partial [Geminicoccaceae bacterium]